jgi:hypothetical protein
MVFSPNPRTLVRRRLLALGNAVRAVRAAAAALGVLASPPPASALLRAAAGAGLSADALGALRSVEDALCWPQVVRLFAGLPGFRFVYGCWVFRVRLGSLGFFVPPASSTPGVAPNKGGVKSCQGVRRTIRRLFGCRRPGVG